MTRLRIEFPRPTEQLMRFGIPVDATSVEIAIGPDITTTTIERPGGSSDPRFIAMHLSLTTQ